MSKIIKTIVLHKAFFFFLSMSTIIYFLATYSVISRFGDSYRNELKLETELIAHIYQEEFQKVFSDIEQVRTYINTVDDTSFTQESFNAFIENNSLEYEGFIGLCVAPDGVREFFYTEMQVDIPLDVNILENDDETISLDYQYSILTGKTVIDEPRMVPAGVYGIVFRTAYFEDGEFAGIINYTISKEYLDSQIGILPYDITSSIIVDYNNETIFGDELNNQESVTTTYLDKTHTNALIKVQESTSAQRNQFMGNVYIGTGFVILYFIIIALWTNYYSKNYSLLKKQKQLINYDNLTGLPNRLLFEEETQHLIDNKIPFVLGFGDLDNFKNINDVLGHTVGDHYLSFIANQMKEFTSNKIKIYRWGGDEFIFVFQTSERSQIFESIERIFDLFKEPFDINGSKHQISISIGLVEFPLHGTNLDDLVKRADIVMYDVKSNQKNTYSFFKQVYLDELMEEIEFQQKVDEINLKDSELYLQPIVHTNTNEVVGFEALSRIKDNNGNPLNTLRVIKSLEKDGLITKLDKQVFRGICEIMSKFQSTIQMNYFISFNISPLSLNNDYIEFIERTVKSYRLNPSNFIIEIIETLGFKDVNQSVNLLNRIKQSGFRIAMDDFGMGYSSLSYISKLPLDLIKIDKSFIDTYKTDKFNQTILMTIQDISKSLKVNTLAEGIETKEQLEYIKSLGTMYYQGFYHSKPERAEDILFKSLQNK